MLAALLRCVPWKGDGKSLGALLLPPPRGNVAIVGIYQGHVYRVGRDGKYEQLFADCDEARAVGVREIELAAAHIRVADQCNGVNEPNKAVSWLTAGESVDEDRKADMFLNAGIARIDNVFMTTRRLFSALERPIGTPKSRE